MATHGKRYRTIKAELEPGEVRPIEEAVEFFRGHPAAEFDETLELSFRMGVDPTKSDQAIRSTVALPHGTGKNVRVVVFATGEAANAAREAGAEEVGFEDLVQRVQDGWLDFDIAVATPETMKEVRKLGRVLGPRGLMPNPKTGTVSDDTAAAVREAKAGRVEFRMDRDGNISVPFGKRSFSKEALVDNANAVIDAVMAARPAAAKGAYIRRCTIATTMGPGIQVALRRVAA